MNTSRSQGSAILARTGQTQATIAARVGKSRSLVGHWFTGTRIPEPEDRVALWTAYGVPVESWEQAASAPPIPAVPPLSPSPPSPPTELANVRVRSRAVELSRVADQLLKDACGEGVEMAQRAKIVASATQSLALLGKITGESRDLSVKAILGSPAWRRILDTAHEALRAHPEAMRALGEALLRLEKE